MKKIKITIQTGRIDKIRTSAAIIPVFDEEEPGRDAGRIDKALAGMIRRHIKRGDFKPRLGSTSVLYPEGRIPAERVILAGAGKKSEFTLDRLRQAAAKAVVFARHLGAPDAIIPGDITGLDPTDAGQAVAEAAVLGLYRFLKYKTDEQNDYKGEIKRLTIVSEDAGGAALLRKGAKAGEVISDAAVMVRDMVSHPSSDMTPAVVADIAKDLGKRYRLKVKVLERNDMKRLGMGALLGVSSGSVQPPKFIIVEYLRGGKRPFIALVGKTITFDSGGISIKPAENMDKMKDDMSGGAAVLGAIRAAAELDLPLNIVGLLPATENMPSGSAYKPGDVLKTISGKTIEIINTDAEGRLILSDALGYACRYKPAVIVDIATLTGACRIALGQEAIGMLGSDGAFKQKMREAGEKTGERVWELPLWEGYYDLIESDIADMKNTGGRDGGVITAACLLSKFVEKYPWVHLDIAATAWIEKDRPYIPKGATGVGVRLLTQFLRDLAHSKE